MGGTRACIFGAILWTCVCCQPYAAGQNPADAKDEIPIERCDVLPVVTVKIAGQPLHFLLDTGATSILNVKAFSSGPARKLHIDSWQGGAAASARQVTLPDFALGNHSLHNLKLPAIDLSPIAKACGGEIDGILGVDLLDRMGVTIDLERRVAVLHMSPSDQKGKYADMEGSMHHCTLAFNQGRVDELADCLDPEIVLYTPDGEYRGRKQVMQYLSDMYLKYAPNVRFQMTTHDVRIFGDALWYSYDYTLDRPGEHRAGHGMAMCQREEGKWRMLNMHNALMESPAATDSK